MTGIKSLQVPLGFNEEREKYFSILYLDNLWPMTAERGGSQRMDYRTNLPMWRASVKWQPLDYRERDAIGGPYRLYQQEPLQLLVTIFGWGGRQVELAVFEASKRLAKARKDSQGAEVPQVRIQLVDPELFIGMVDKGNKQRGRGARKELTNHDPSDTGSEDEEMVIRLSAYGIKLWKPPEEATYPDEAAADSGHDDEVSSDAPATATNSGLEVIEASDLLATPCE